MPPELNFKEVDLIYNDYMRIMASMREKLKLIYNQFVLKFLTESQRQTLGLQPDYSSLTLPGHPELPSQEQEKKPQSIYDDLDTEEKKTEEPAEQNEALNETASEDLEQLSELKAKTTVPSLE